MFPGIDHLVIAVADPDDAAAQYEWDRRKARRNERKNGVTFLEAETVFSTRTASRCLTNVTPRTSPEP